jgi:transposase InsO family protein
MPWQKESPMEQKQRFVSLAQSGRFSVTELCEEFGISRKTGHKWLARFREEGTAGLGERSRAPKSVSGRTAECIERLIVSERRLHPTWGPKKIRKVLNSKHGVERPPAVSTVGEVLKRHGLVKSARRRGGVFKVERATLSPPERCNHVLGVDFKGWFALGNGERCDPLTVSDLHSRFLLKAEALPQATTRWTKREFRSLFKRYGLPEIIRVDNGAPFASMGPGGLSKLSVWWISLGIEVQFTRPGCPQDNGCHERMHRTMKAECCRPASVNRWAQQQRFDRWRKVFNEQRPHEALGMRTPAEVYQASARRLDERIKPDLYSPGVETMKVGASGFIALNGSNCYVGESFGGVHVALDRDETTGLIHVRYANVKLGCLENAPNARLRPPAYAERWESKLAPAQPNE